MEHKKLFLEETHNITSVKVIGQVEFDRAAHPLKPHIHTDSMEICFIVRGRQSYTVGNKSYMLKGSEIFLTYPNEEHSTTTPYQEKSRLYYIHVDTMNNRENFLGFANSEAIYLAKSLQKIPNRHFRGNSKIFILLGEIYKLAEENSELAGVLIKCHVLQLLYETLLCSDNTDFNVSPDILKAVDFISENLEEPLTTSQLADICILSLPRFKHKFREELGVSPGEYIMRERLCRAKELMQTELSITEIAYKLNFSSGQHFSSAFKKYCGISPTEYMNKFEDNLKEEGK